MGGTRSEGDREGGTGGWEEAGSVPLDDSSIPVYATFHFPFSPL